MNRLITLLLWFIHAAHSSQSVEDISPLPFPLTPVQPFAPTYDSVKTQECKNHALKFIKDLRERRMWALKMYDASGKVSSGVLRGNVMWLGDEKECFSVSSEPIGKESGGNDIVRGQYCLARIFAKPKTEEVNSSQGSMHEVFDLIYTHHDIRSNYDEPIGFFPTFSAMYVGLCVPQTCTPTDVKAAVAAWLFPGNTSQQLGMDVNVVVHDDGCMKEDLKMSTKGKICIFFCALMTVIAIAGGIYDFKTEKEREEGSGHNMGKKGLLKRVLLAFSLRRTMRNLFDTKAPPGDLGCIHGTRAIFSLALFIIHKFISVMLVPLANRDYFDEGYMQGYISMLMRSFWGLVDTFVFMSGFLTAYSAFTGLAQGRPLKIMTMYIYRYLKFTPVFFITIFWTEIIFEQEFSLPQYLHFGKYFADNCKRKWLNILTYTNTFKGIGEMCYPNSHQLETDMHMYLLSPFINLFLWKMPKIAIPTILGAMAFLSYSKYKVIMNEELTAVVYYGSYVSNFSKAADFIYLNFIYRLIPYLSGILLAYYLRDMNKKRKLPKVFLFAGSVMALWSAHYSFFRMINSSRPGSTVDITESAKFGTVQPLLWSFAISWLFYVCITGQAEWLNKILSWKGFQITTRLSYAFYISQMSIMLVEAGKISLPIKFSPFSLIDLNTITKVVLATIWLTLMFLMPFTELWDLANGKSKIKAEKKQE